ncbi:MAG: PIN domain nuclease [Sideroxyarcus sp.]|nr:PIN domain nuclease [Sideroxyarcus sp.]
MILVDASVWIDYFNGVANVQTDRLDALLGQESILMGDIIMTEVLQGFASDIEFKRALNLLALLPFREMLGREVALQTARNYRALRKQGVTVRKTVDVMIGTFCILNNIPLLHKDRDFDPMEKWLGLMVVKGCDSN